MLYFTMNKSFDGVTRSCVKWTTAKGGVLRCAAFEKGRKYPTCPAEGLKGGGRSQNYIRGKKVCKTRGGKPKRRSVKSRK